MKPYYENESGKLLQGSALEILKQLESESVQCCVTSPPYWSLRDYGTATWKGGKVNCDHMKGTLQSSKTTLHPGTSQNDKRNFAGMPYKDICKKCGAIRIDEQLGLESTPEEYVEKMVEIFREVKRVLKKDGTLWLNLGDFYAGSWKGGGNNNLNNPHCEKINPGFSSKDIKPKDLIGIPWTVAFALRADGWYLRQDIIWSKPNPMPESMKDRCTKSHEYIFLMTKNAKYYYDADAIKETAAYAGQNRGGSHNRYEQNNAGMDNKIYNNRNKRSVWTVLTKPYSGAHFATFPEKLIEPCILAGSKPGDIVLDLFMGSGTVAVVCHRFGRSWLGVELSQDYCEIARARIKEASKQSIIPGFNE